MSDLKSHPHLTLREHLEQIRAAAEAVWARHGKRLRWVCAEAVGWFDDAVCLHDAGKGSLAFQEYIRDPEGYLRRNRPDSKAHTPLSAVCALLHGCEEGWPWRRALAVTQAALGHHTEFHTHEDMARSLNGYYSVIDRQLVGLDWPALRREVGVPLPDLTGRGGLAVMADACDFLEGLAEEHGKLPLAEAVWYRLLCQLSFSVLLEADKAFLAVRPADVERYLQPRRAELPPRVVDDLLKTKPATPLDGLRQEVRQELLAGIEAAGEARVLTLTLPTGTGKTLLAATWALEQRQRLAASGLPPLVVVVLPYLSIIDQTTLEYEEMFEQLGLAAGDVIGYHSLSDRTYAPDLEDESQDFFLDSWQSSVVLTTFDQFLLALLSPRTRHQMRFHHLADAVVILDEVQTLPCVLWAPLRAILEQLVRMGDTRLLAMSATQPGFLPEPTELVAQPERFFGRMNRYRLVLRHREPRPLSSFVAEGLRRVPEWRDRRVLLTLNTRRSARQVRDGLAPAAEEQGIPLEFLSADVTPADRLKALTRIRARSRAGQPCLVVSTQCIEAGVDIDMDLVIRDFGPLDSLIQVAGRCNRNGGHGPEVVEVVSLQDEPGPRFLADYVYDRVLLEVTREVLAGRDEVAEAEVYPLTVSYFDALRREKDTGDKILEDWARWRETERVRHLLRGPERPKVDFVVVENDPSLPQALAAAGEVADRWEKRRAFRSLAGRVARQTVSVYERKGLDPCRYAAPFPEGKMGKDVWFWLLRPGHYSAERGLVLDDSGPDESEGWGAIV